MIPKKYFRTGFEHEPDYVSNQIAALRLLSRHPNVSMEAYRDILRRIDWLTKLYIRKRGKARRLGRQTTPNTRQNEVPVKAA